MPENTETSPDPCAGGHAWVPGWINGEYKLVCANSGCTATNG